MSKFTHLTTLLPAILLTFSSHANSVETIQGLLLKPLISNGDTNSTSTVETKNDQTNNIPSKMSLSFNGDIQVDNNPRSIPQIVVSDIPGSTTPGNTIPRDIIKVTRNKIPEKSHDMDFFKLHGTWYKIKTGTAIISTDNNGKTTVKSVSIVFDSLLDGYASPTVYDIENPTDYWANKDGSPYLAHDYLNDLVSQGLLKPQEFIDPRGIHQSAQ